MSLFQIDAPLAFGDPGHPLGLENKITFLFESYLDGENVELSASSTATGFFSNVRSFAGGGGTMAVQGAFEGTGDLNIIIRINVEGAVGVARYYVSLDGGLTFHTNTLSGYLTSSSAVDTPSFLTDLGISIVFTDTLDSGLESFYVGDEYQFMAYRPFLEANLRVWSGEERWRGTTVNETIRIDLDSGSSPINAIVLHGHNFGDSDSVQIQASTDSGFVTIVADVNAVIADKQCCVLFESSPVYAQFWRIIIDTTTSGVIPQISHLFMGQARQLTRDLNRDFSYEKERFVRTTSTDSGREYTTVIGMNRYFKADFTNLKPSDRPIVESMWDTTHQQNQQVRPLYVVNLVQSPNDYLFAHFNQQKLGLPYSNYNRFAWSASFRESR